MRRVVIISWLFVLAVSGWGGVWAAQRIAHQQQQLPEVPPSVTATLPPVDEKPLAAGQIVAIDEAMHRVTIAHRGIVRFYLEPGNTVFSVRDPSLLTGLAPGDKVRFDADREGKKHFVLTKLENSN